MPSHLFSWVKRGKHRPSQKRKHHSQYSSRRHSFKSLFCVQGQCKNSGSAYDIYVDKNNSMHHNTTFYMIGTVVHYLLSESELCNYTFKGDYLQYRICLLYSCVSLLNLLCMMLLIRVRFSIFCLKRGKTVSFMV